MRLAVWKYELRVDTSFPLMVPLGGVALHMAVQDGVPCLWVLVNPDADKTERRIHMVGTGHREVDETWAYLGTVQLHGYVWHYFEQPSP